MRSERRRGFTLLELAVMLAIAGISLAVAAPALIPRNGGDPARAELILRLHRARAAAARGGRESVLVLHPASGGYRVLLRGAGGDSTLEEGTLAGSRGGPDGSAAEWVVRFDPLGRAAGLPLRWPAPNGGTRLLRVDPWTGEVSVDAR